MADDDCHLPVSRARVQGPCVDPQLYRKASTTSPECSNKPPKFEQQKCRDCKRLFRDTRAD